LLSYDQAECQRASRKLKCKIALLSLGADPLDYAIQPPLCTDPSGEDVFSGESTFSTEFSKTCFPARPFWTVLSVTCSTPT
jgi:hypothetical protein